MNLLVWLEWVDGMSVWHWWAVLGLMLLAEVLHALGCLPAIRWPGRGGRMDGASDAR
jgi:hypothetical protein